MVKVKICGLSRQCDIDAVNETVPDYIGFVFAAGRRRVTHPQASELRERLIPGIAAVGVFVNEPIENITPMVEDGTIDMVQLHGNETDGYIASLKRSVDVPVIKAVTVRDARTVEGCIPSAADMIMLDGGSGEGRTFDWNVIKKMERPFFLAGGLTPENVSEAIRRTMPFAVDVSSGVETDGLKDNDKIKEFIRRARDA